MRIIISALAMSLALTTSPVTAKPDATEVDHLEPLRFLVGHCWKARFPNSEATDTHCWEDMLGGVFIRDTHIVEGRPEPYAGEAVYGVPATSDHATYVYFNSLGGSSEGSMIVDGNRILFPGEVHRNADGTEMIMRSVMTRIGEDRYSMTTEQQTNDGWRQLWAMEFQKVDQAQPQN